MSFGLHRDEWPVALGLAALGTALGLLAGAQPALAVAAALVIPFAVLALADIAVGLAGFVFVSFFTLGSYGIADGLARLVLALALFALLATPARALRGPGPSPIASLSEHQWTLVPLGLFLAWAALSLVWADNAGEALTALRQYLGSAGLFLVTAVAIRTRGDLRLVLAAFVLGAVGAAFVGMLFPPPEQEGRLSSPLLDPNVLAASLVASVPLSVALFSISRSIALKALSVGTAAFCLIAIWLTGSRGGLLAGIALILAGVVLAKGYRVQIAVLGALLAATSYIFFAAFAPADLQERVTQPFAGNERIQEGRTTIWTVAWRGFESSPIEGLGAGNFRTSSQKFVLQPGLLARTDEVLEKPQVVHNSYLEVLTELGVVGAILFAGVIGSCLAAALRAAGRFAAAGDPGMQVASICVALALVGTLAAIFFFSDEYGKQLWLLAGIGPALLTLGRAEAGPDESPR